jgi:hypothetical protein
MTKPVTQMSSRVRPTNLKGLAMDAIFTAAQPYIADTIEGYVAPAIGKGAQFLGDFIKGTAGTVSGGVEQGVYDYMTKDPETGTRTMVPSQDIAEYKRANFRKGIPAKSKKLAEERGFPEEYFRTTPRVDKNIIEDVGRSERALSRFDGPDWLVDDPARTAKWAGRAALPAAVVGGLGALEYFTQGEKPMTDYAMPVQPDRGGYNPNVEASQASNYYQNQILDKKHAHALELQQLREQARTPGVQDISQGNYGSGLMSSNPFGGVIGNAFGNTRVFPEDPGITSIPLR